MSARSFLRTARRLAAAVPLVLVLTGCATTIDASLLGVPATLASPNAQPAQGEHFEISKKAVYAFWGLLPLSKPDARKILASQLVGGQSIADVKVRIRSRWTDVLLTGLTLGILAPRSVTYEGTVVGAGAAQP